MRTTRRQRRNRHIAHEELDAEAADLAAQAAHKGRVAEHLSRYRIGRAPKTEQTLATVQRVMERRPGAPESLTDAEKIERYWAQIAVLQGQRRGRDDHRADKAIAALEQAISDIEYGMGRGA